MTRDVGLGALVLATAIGVAGCHDSPLAPATPATLELAPAQSVQVDQTRLTFVDVAEDSRCPLNANCVQQGDVSVDIEVVVEGRGDAYNLFLNAPDRKSIVHRGVRVTLTAVEPYPVAGTPTVPGAYRATFEVVAEP